MTTQERINKYLQREIDREVMIKAALKKNEKEQKIIRSESRRKIEILKEQKALEDEYLLNYE